MEHLAFIIPIVSITVAIVFIALIIQKSKLRQLEFINKERLAIIEKGVYEFPGDSGRVDYAKYLFLSLLLMTFGLAIFIGSFIENDSDMIIGALVFGLPGAGIFLFYYIQTRKDKELSRAKSNGIKQ